MPHSPRRVAYITAGAAGLYCGSCLRDNTLVRALRRAGDDVQLIPLYTPLRTDEADTSIDRVFFGGVNVYLQQKSALFRHLPGAADRWLDHPRLIRWAASRAVQTDPRRLGELTVSMLRGRAGRQAKEVDRLCRWLARRPAPHLVNLTNMLIAGCAPALKEALGSPILATLQGDDLFLEQLDPPHRSQALAEIRRLVRHVDGFLAVSRYYADFMADYFQIPPEKLHVTPLGIEMGDFEASDESAGPPPREGRAPTVGYLARLAPEKGLHLLIDAFLQLRRKPGMADARLHVAGCLVPSHRAYAAAQFGRLRAAGLEGAFQYLGEVDRRGKIAFLRGIDLLSVPTVYRDPKGLFVLEALAAGTPVVQPAHGAFPELIEALGGGRLTAPHDAAPLAEALYELLRDDATRRRLGARGRAAVRRGFNADAMARATRAVYERYWGE